MISDHWVYLPLCTMVLAQMFSILPPVLLQTPMENTVKLLPKFSIFSSQGFDTEAKTWGGNIAAPVWKLKKIGGPKVKSILIGERRYCWAQYRRQLLRLYPDLGKNNGHKRLDLNKYMNLGATKRKKKTKSSLPTRCSTWLVTCIIMWVRGPSPLSILASLLNGQPWQNEIYLTLSYKSGNTNKETWLCDRSCWE